MKRRLAFALCALAGAVSGCGRPDVDLTGSARGAPVILISVDTLRSDRLPAYGYQGVETPAFDAFRRQAILFERVYAHMPLTLPSHASMFTGLLPPEHGVRDNIGYELEADELPFLPRLLKEAGYATGGAVSAFVLRADTGMASGFDFYDAEVQSLTWTGQLTAQRPGEETLDRARAWLQEVRDRPFFLFFHIYEPHTPRRPPQELGRRYADPYDGEVAAADAIVGELLAELRRLGVYDRSLVILTSDHGEGLDDHGEDEHGVLLYRESLQVPLMIRLPGGAQGGSSRSEPAGLADLTPTILALAGLEIPDGLSGRPLLGAPAGDGPAPLYAETLYPRLHFGWNELTSIIRYPHHLIWGPDPELYDLEQDPDERQNLLRRNQRLAAELRQILESLDRPFQSPAEADPEVARQLAALGYIGSTSAVAREGPLPDPKARLHVLRDLQGAFASMQSGEYPEAVRQFRQALEEEPGMVDAWGQLGHALMAMSSHEKALEAFQQAFELSGGAPRLALSVGNALIKLGRLDEARAHVGLAVAAGENAFELLARLAVLDGDLDGAEEFLERGLQRSGGRGSLLILKAQVAVERGDLAGALTLTDEVLASRSEEADPRMLSGLYFVRGEVFGNMGEPEKAEEAFRREIEINPGELAAYGRLALLHVLQDRPREATTVLRRMLDDNPRPAAFLEAVRTLRVVGDERSARIVLAEALRRWPDDPELREAG